MSGRQGRRLWRAWTLGALLYAVFLITAPFEHHDLACHVKTPFHCTSCSSSVVGSGPHAPTVLDGSHQPDAGRPAAATLPTHGCLLTSPSTGRSPPLA